MGATLDGMVADEAAVFEAKFMLPWDSSKESAAERLGGISKQGDRCFRRLISGAHAVLQYARQGRSGSGSLLQRRPFKLVAVALANKMARIAWAVLARDENYRTTPETLAA